MFGCVVFVILMCDYIYLVVILLDFELFEVRSLFYLLLNVLYCGIEEMFCNNLVI